MTDLSSREMQSTFKKLQRITLTTNIMMCIVTALAAAIAIWGTATAKGKANWSEIMFYVLIAAIVSYFVAVMVWEIFLRRKYSAAMHLFIAEGFRANKNLLNGGGTTNGNGTVELETSLAGDKLVVMCGNGEYVQFDLAPVKNYSSVCAYTVRLAKRYVRDYYSLAARKGGIESAVLTDRIPKRAKRAVYVEGGKPKNEFLLKFSYYIKHGLIN
ncbi:MAG: hypothetical protein K2J54_05170, partial [Clostridia bacterium]|nr:hypothetical protein [Clostridia bacterium]MDE7084955.1 hypothetical protein [Clostridia bacterium]